MRLPRPHPSTRHRHDPKRRADTLADAAAEPIAEAAPAREPDDGNPRPEVADAGFRASSYDLQRGLDVVELSTSLPADVLARLFKSPQR